MQFAAAVEFGGFVAAGEEAVVAYSDEAFGRDVEEEAAQEFGGAEGHPLFFGVVLVVFPGEGDAAVVDVLQAAVADTSTSSAQVAMRWV